MDRVIPDDVRRQLRLPKAGQIGYVVSDVSKTVAYCRDALGIRPWLLLDKRPDPCIEKGKRVHPVLKIALAHAGGVQIELIEVIEGESYHLDHLKGSEAKIHHLGFKDCLIILQFISVCFGRGRSTGERVTLTNHCLKLLLGVRQ